MTQGAWHRPKTARTTALACGRRLTLAWYRRKQRARQAVAVACACAGSFRGGALARNLDRCEALERETMAIIAELAALTAGGSSQAMV